MRQILFRGFHKDVTGKTVITVDGEEKHGEWIYGYYVYDYRRNANYIATNSSGATNAGYKPPRESYDLDFTEVIPSTIGQFTGYSNAFEYDIVKHQDKHGHTVYGIIKFGEYDDSSKIHMGFYIEWQNDGMNTWDDWWRHDLKYWFERSTEIIGNVFENSDLIGDGENA